MSLMSQCVIWLKAKGGNGYGYKRHNGKVVQAHRLAWEQANGPIPKGMHVLHKCDNKLCINPEHLYLGTHGDNMKDMYDRNPPDTADGGWWWRQH